MSNAKILFAPIILEGIEQGKIVAELPAMKRIDAENVARHFRKDFEFTASQIYANQELSLDLQKAYAFRDKGEYKKAIEAFERLLKQNQSYNEKIALYNEIALCYRLKGDKHGAAEIYKKVVRDPVNIDLDNYMVIEQAYFYLSEFEKRQHNLNISNDYYNKSIATLEYIIKNFPVTKSAEWASLTIGTYELLRGNIKEAQKRAVIGKRGDYKGQAYLLLGLCYEYQKKFEEAKKEYKSLIKNFPDVEESKVAHEFIENLDNNKTNIEEFFKMLNLF